MRSKRSLEGYLLIDNSASGGAKVEVPVLTCSHCQAQIIVNPLRTRDRNHCRKCDAYVCDKATCILECNGSLNRVFDQALDQANRGIIF